MDFQFYKMNYLKKSGYFIIIVFTLLACIAIVVKLHIDKKISSERSIVHHKLIADLNAIASALDTLEKKETVSIADIKNKELILTSGAVLSDFKVYPTALDNTPLVEYYGPLSKPYVLILYRGGYTTQLLMNSVP
jgi:hypothetical protein